MRSNIEIKAKTRNFSEQKKLAATFSDSPEELLQQEDTFFNVPNGRLKLRAFSDGHGELIFYQRDNTSGPKQSNYSISTITDPKNLKEVLVGGLGLLGVVRKKRYLYRVGQTRIHLDDVEGLGYFIELEVVMQPEQTATECHQIAQQIMDTMNIQEKDLIDVAYIDLIFRNKQHP